MMAWMQVHRRSILFVLTVLALAGVLASFYLPVSLFPNTAFPRVVLALDAGDRPADLMMLSVTQPVEEAVRRVPGVRSVRSTTSRGSAEVSVNFDWGTDMAMATTMLSQAVAQIMPTLPAGTRLDVRRMDPAVYPMLAYSLTSDIWSQAQLYDLARYQLRPLLLGVNGVARVEVQGGEQEEYQVFVDPARLDAYGIGVQDVVRALAAANVEVATGRMEDHDKLYLVVVNTRLHSLADLRQLVLRVPSGSLIPLARIADIRDGVVPHWIRVTANGKRAVLLNIYQQRGGNSVQVSRDVAARLAGYRSHLSSGVHLSNWYDQSELILASALGVRDAMIWGTILAILTVWLFLRNARITLIALVIVPAVLAITVLVMFVLHMSFNIMTLGGMAAAVGLIIDDAITMTEYIVRRLRDGSGAVAPRIHQAVHEFVLPLAGSSASTTVIFVPLAFLTGVTGAFFKALSLTMGVGLLISFFVTWLAAPILSEYLLHESETGEDGAFMQRVQRFYGRILRAMLKRPQWVLLLLLPIVLVGWLALSNIDTGFMPAMDEGGFTMDYLSLPGTSLTETNRLLNQVEAILKADPDVATWSRRTGAQLGGGITEANEGDFFIRLRRGKRAPIEAVMERVRIKIQEQVPGLDIELSQLMEDEIGDLTSVPQPIEIKLFGDDDAQLQRAALRVQSEIGRIAGVVDTRDGIHPAGNALEVHVDRVRAALEGMTVDGIMQTVSADLAGTVATVIQHVPKLIGVRVWLPPAMRQRDNDILHLRIRAPDGHFFPLGRVASVQSINGQPQIERENLLHMIAVTARISGRSMGAVMPQVQRVVLARGNLPPGMYAEFGGLYAQQQAAFRGMMLVFVAAFGLVLVLLLLLFESFRVALSIAAMSLLSIPAVLAGLWMFGNELDISSLMGMTMIIGIVTESAIFYFSGLRRLAKRMPLDEALVLAGQQRIRPISMTVAAAVMTLLPLAVTFGQTASMQQPLAVAVIAGLLIKPVLLLLVMPVLYRLTVRKVDA